jgi:hypothetical protein
MTSAITNAILHYRSFGLSSLGASQPVGPDSTISVQQAVAPMSAIMPTGVERCAVYNTSVYYLQQYDQQRQTKQNTSSAHVLAFGERHSRVEMALWLTAGAEQIYVEGRKRNK